jgi:competence protein ComEC
MIYDAGNWKDNGATAMLAIQEIIPEGSTIDLLVISHSDADHLGAVPEICEKYKLTRVIRDGVERTTKAWKRADDAIEQEVIEDDCADINLAHVDLEPGETFDLGQATATFVCGFFELPEDWPLKGDSEKNNAGSIVMRLDYAGRSILFTGDTVGRHINDPVDACIAAEKFMVDNAPTIPIDSDVILAPHHGADNGSSTAFISAVSPEFVIFSAGSDHEHPRQATAERYIAAGVNADKMFRTDLGDNEGGNEWESVSGADPDKPGDDDVEVLLTATGDLQVRYRDQIFEAAPELFADMPRRGRPRLHALDGVTPIQPVQPKSTLGPIQPLDKHVGAAMGSAAPRCCPPVVRRHGQQRVRWFRPLRRGWRR